MSPKEELNKIQVQTLALMLKNRLAAKPTEPPQNRTTNLGDVNPSAIYALKARSLVIIWRSFDAAIMSDLCLNWLELFACGARDSGVIIRRYFDFAGSEETKYSAMRDSFDNLVDIGALVYTESDDQFKLNEIIQEVFDNGY